MLSTAAMKLPQLNSVLLKLIFEKKHTEDINESTWVGNAGSTIPFEVVFQEKLGGGTTVVINFLEQPELRTDFAAYDAAYPNSYESFEGGFQFPSYNDNLERIAIPTENYPSGESKLPYSNTNGGRNHDDYENDIYDNIGDNYMFQSNVDIGFEFEGALSNDGKVKPCRKKEKPQGDDPNSFINADQEDIDLEPCQDPEPLEEDCDSGNDGAMIPLPTVVINDDIFDLSDEEFCERIGGCDIAAAIIRRNLRSQIKRKKRTAEFKKQCKELEKTPSRCEGFAKKCGACETSLNEVCPDYFTMKSKLSKRVDRANQQMMQSMTYLSDEFETNIKQLFKLQKNGQFETIVQTAKYNEADETLSLKIEFNDEETIDIRVTNASKATPHQLSNIIANHL